MKPWHAPVLNTNHVLDNLGGPDRYFPDTKKNLVISKVDFDALYTGFRWFDVHEGLIYWWTEFLTWGPVVLSHICEDERMLLEFLFTCMETFRYLCKGGAFPFFCRTQPLRDCGALLLINIIFHHAL